jgi:predicted enzyme related to lactoylglutathione lyase
MHPIVHFELHTADPDKTLPFFEKIFGWKINKWGGGPKEYWLAETAEAGKPGINGGFLRSPDGQPRTVNTIQVPDVDEYVAKCVAAGGENCVPKMPIPGVGWLAYCTDPTGVLFGLHTPDPSAK